eukprot:TRINITY_DN1047_c0_g1_i1.p2 TRINITY_DN1047_c0_g1~~TRINITY_DN1047_c0_g1_i1.p2  ORF type:complete len:155 (+),score=1.44 TRINITY_DN1047_c0_g1_i1:517-981(+)
MTRLSWRTFRGAGLIGWRLAEHPGKLLGKTVHITVAPEAVVSEGLLLPVKVEQHNSELVHALAKLLSSFWRRSCKGLLESFVSGLDSVLFGQDPDCIVHRPVVVNRQLSLAFLMSLSSASGIALATSSCSFRLSSISLAFIVSSLVAATAARAA